ncbi:MAG: dehydrogenase [Proteobacteria bacterium]|nr:dehydrogenase [Pseudomonadota bacterium]
MYDFVIVGAGSAGCVLAARLSEDPNVNVLLIEAGGWDTDPLVRVPLTWVKLLLEQRHDWGYFFEPEESVESRTIECARGKIIGGSSSVNAMAYVRGNRSDYDRWANEGLTNWSFEKVLPYFRKLENWEHGESEYRGGSGPLRIQNCRYQDSLSDAVLAGAKTLGYSVTEDYNAVQQEGFGRLQMTIDRGRRCSSADAYLKPARSRSNLEVMVGTLVTELIFDGSNVVGVETLRRGQTERIHAGSEVILSAGVINTPQLLQLSGIGESQHLSKIGIKTKVEAPGVGKNLQDQVSAVSLHGRKDKSPFLSMMRADRIAREFCRAYLFGTGFAADVPGGVTAFVRTREQLSSPDLQILLTAAPLVAFPYMKPFRKPFSDGFVIRSVLLDSASRGVVQIQSSDPTDKPLIQYNFLSVDTDFETLRAGLKLSRELVETQELSSFVAQEILPGSAKTSDEDLDDHIRRTAITLHHPLGTCRMGLEKDSHAVVDQHLRVKGVDGLRIVDASVMPDLIRGNINGPIMMIAEKAADMILGKTPT